MASKRAKRRRAERGREHGCGFKRAHNTFAQAQAHIDSLRSMDGLCMAGDLLHPYRCPYCGRWHVGHK
jgi:hypothetical protein